MDQKKGQGGVGFKLIGIFKLVCALIYFALAIGVFRLMKRDVAESLERAIEMVRLDPGNHFIDSAIHWASGIDKKHMKAIGFGTFFYGALELVEGVGLLMQQRWVGYLTIFATALLIPLEVYELAKKPNAAKVIILILNVLIVIYLIWKLRQERKAEAETAGKPDGPATQP